jgi:hypothetical protein
LKKRAKEIADQAHNFTSIGEATEFLGNLDDLERLRKSNINSCVMLHSNGLVFVFAHQGAKAVRQWMADLKKI